MVVTSVRSADKLTADHLERLCRGHPVTICSAFPSVRWMDAHYANLRACLTSLADERHAQLLLEEAAQRWLATEDHTSYYCGAPPGFRDRQRMPGRPNKMYVQHAAGYASFLADAADAELFRLVPALLPVMRRLEVLTDIGNRLFVRVLERTPALAPEVSRRWLSRSPLPVVTRALAYRPTTTWTSTPHVDKALMAFVLRPSNLEARLLSTPFGSGAPATAVKHPPVVAGRTGTILLPGVMLPRVSQHRTRPAAHAVEPLGTRPMRLATVVFLLVPHGDTNGVETNVSWLDS